MNKCNAKNSSTSNPKEKYEAVYPIIWSHQALPNLYRAHALSLDGYRNHRVAVKIIRFGANHHIKARILSKPGGSQFSYQAPGCLRPTKL
jgi:hypothetical protein